MVPTKPGEADKLQTEFSLAQLADPDTAESEKILRTCVHCGFCTATCPTYVLLGDELDSPRGRIYLIKNMLEEGGKVAPETVKHIDRCLSCLSCMTTCPSGVQLHAPRRSRPAPYRGALPPALARAAVAAAARQGADQPGPAARGAAPGAARQAVRRARAKTAAPAAGAGAAPHTGGLAAASDRDLSGRGRAAHAGRAAAGLRAAGAGAGDQPGDDPAA